MTIKHEIEIEGLPEGWKPVAYRRPVFGEYYFYNDDIQQGKTGSGQFLIVERIKPRSIKVEDTGEIRQPREGEYVFNNGNLCLCRKPERWGHEHQIWRVVEEGERSSTTFRESM